MSIHAELASAVTIATKALIKKYDLPEEEALKVFAASFAETLDSFRSAHVTVSVIRTKRSSD